MPAKFINTCYPVPSNNSGHDFSSADALLSVLNGESSGLYLVGSQGMWHGGIHITDATVPWCALSGGTAAEQEYLAHRPPHKGEQFIRCMADGEIVAWRVCKDYDSMAIVWRGENIYLSTSFVLVKHYVQPGNNASSGLTFHTLYMNMAPFATYATHGATKDRKLTGEQRYYASAQDVLVPHHAGSLPKDTAVTLSDTIITRASDRRQFTQVTLSAPAKNAAGETLAAGTTVWTVSDQGSLKAAASAVPIPSWWAKCSPAYTVPADGGAPCTAHSSLNCIVIPPTPIAIKAGENIGHMGFYQLPEHNGKLSRYQVHIECLSMDDALPTFLTNPDQVGADSPTYLKYPKGALLYAKYPQDTMVATDRTTRAPGILTLSGVPCIEANGAATHYQIHPEGGWLAATDIKTVSQYALGERGFVTLDQVPESLELIDGEKPPNNLVKGILEQLYQAAKDEPRISYVMNQYNYKRLLDQIDRNDKNCYPEQEYLQAVHLPSYRDHLYRIIAKHPSEWYYGKDDPLRKAYLDKLTHDQPLWKIYLETFIDRMGWMKSVASMGPMPWHMHPVVFLDALRHQSCDCENLYADKFTVTRYFSVYGPVYKGVIRLKDYPRWDILIAKGELTLDEKEILIAMSENEGNMDAIQSYDSEVVTAGAMQKTVKDTYKRGSKSSVDYRGKGELSTQLAKFKKLHLDLYNRYAVNCGWTVEGTGPAAIIYYCDPILTHSVKITASDLKKLIRKGCSKETSGQIIYNKPLAALLKVIQLPEYLDLQVLDFIDRLHYAEDEVVSAKAKIKDFVKSKFGRAVILDHSVNRPTNVKGDFKKAIDNFYIHHPDVNRDPALWGRDFIKNESNLLEEYKSIREMTDSVARFNSLKAKL